MFGPIDARLCSSQCSRVNSQLLLCLFNIRRLLVPHDLAQRLLDLWFCSEPPPPSLRHFHMCRVEHQQLFAASLLLNIGLSIPLKMWRTNESNPPGDGARGGNWFQMKQEVERADKERTVPCGGKGRTAPKFGKAYPEPELRHQKKIVCLSVILSLDQCFYI